ncbi:MAG: hypothetical protein JWM80_6037 [Cyanobacteria bacterium RYN_339]|nr:hypothetical protein [Cyanobacteria bacterium RYN_339]
MRRWIPALALLALGSGGCAPPDPVELPAVDGIVSAGSVRDGSPDWTTTIYAEDLLDRRLGVVPTFRSSSLQTFVTMVQGQGDPEPIGLAIARDGWVYAVASLGAKTGFRVCPLDVPLDRLTMGDKVHLTFKPPVRMITVPVLGAGFIREDRGDAFSLSGLGQAVPLPPLIPGPEPLPLPTPPAEPSADAGATGDAGASLGSTVPPVAPAVTASVDPAATRGATASPDPAASRSTP